IELIRNNEIENQNELAYKLSDLGYNVTQATVSRDIQKLNLIKVKVNDKFKYAVVDNINTYSDQYIRIIKDTIKSIDNAKNLLVVKTEPGMAMATAAAIDSLKLLEIVGSLAGDDVIFIATKDDDNAMLLKNKLDVLMRKDNS
ncbi:MAG: arginine repressor, partial [Lachnospiraceae bacterium]|nr:arginine repressor [Lachnospiraceae bacterium]